MNNIVISPSKNGLARNMQVLQEYFLQVLQGFLIYLAHILEILQVLQWKWSFSCKIPTNLAHILQDSSCKKWLILQENLARKILHARLFSCKIKIPILQD